MPDLKTKTIEDFGEQWTNFTNNDGFYGSTELFRDAFPLLEEEDIRGKQVLDIGSGTGRIVAMLLALGADHVTAVEPSAAFDVLKQNLADHAERVTVVQAPGDEIDLPASLDCAVSYGVLHHIPDPDPVMKAAHAALKPGGRMSIWLYGREGNGLYLALVGPLRAVTKRLPHWALNALSWALDVPLVLYMACCKVLPLPLAPYMRSIIARLTPEKRRWNIYDQLNPAHAKYYRQAEAIDLMKRAGFRDVQVHHRHGYSWSVLGVK